MDNLGLGNPYTASNPYLDKSVSDSLGDTTKAYNMTTAPAYTSAMVRSGSFGNSGVDQMQQESQRQLQTSLGRQANDMRSNNYQFGQNLGQNQNQFQQNINQNQNQFSQNLGQNQSQFNDNFNRGTYNDAFSQNQQQYQNGINLLGMQNTSNQQNLGFGTQVQNAPMNYYQGFSNSATGIGKGFGTSSQTSFAPGSGIMGALGGAQMGYDFQNSKLGTQISNTLNPNFYSNTNAPLGQNGSGNYTFE